MRRGRPVSIPVAVAIALSSLLLTGCGRGSKPFAPAALAILPIENQTGDPSLDWCRNAIPAVLALQTGSRFAVADRNEARQSGAETVFSGVLVRESGKLVLDGLIQDATNLKTLRTFRVTSSDSDLLKVTDDAAHAIHAQPGRMPLQNKESLRRLGAIYEARTADEFENRCVTFLEKEPGFGPAYETCVSRLAGSGLERVLAMADGHEKQFSTSAAAAIALAHFQTGNMAKARAYYRMLAPRMPEAWNQLIYVEGFLGDYEAAQKSFEEYRKASPNTQPNAFDSLGEVYFLGRRYTDSERAFLEGVKLDPAFAGGIGWLKAGAARLAQGNLAGAEELMANQLKSRPKNDRGRQALELTWRQLLAAGKAGKDTTVALVEKTLIQRRLVQPASR